MKKISRFFFVVGGVIFPRLSSLSINWIESKNERPLTNSQRQNIYRAEKELFIGKITPESYLSLLSDLTPGVTTQSLLAGLLAHVKLDEGALKTARDLKKSGVVYFINDYPRLWLQQAAQNTNLFKWFTLDDVVDTAGLGLENDITAVFDCLSKKNYLHPEINMWVDAYPFRTSTAIRRGIDAIIYVDEYRLRRELKLRESLTD